MIDVGDGWAARALAAEAERDRWSSALLMADPATWRSVKQEIEEDSVQDAPMPGTTASPVGNAVWIDPGRMSGAACVGGTRCSVDAIADSVWIEGVADVMHGWDLTRGQVLNACWYAACYPLGPSKPNGGRWRKRWGAWAEQTHGLLWNHKYDEAPDPPMHDDEES